MTARQVWAHAADIAGVAVLPAATIPVAVAVAIQTDGWLALPVILAGGGFALGAGRARARWYRRSGTS